MPTVLIIGVSRGLGLGLAREYLARGWDVIGTVRNSHHADLDGLVQASGVRLRVEHADITVASDLEALRARLAAERLDLLFINAGVTDEDVPASEVDTDEFTRVMVTNALSPMRALDLLGPMVRDDGTIGIMSSRQGSVSFNTRGGHDVYRASKSALNQLTRSYDARRTDARTLLLLHPGWVRTELGGTGAQLTVDESVSGIVDTIESQSGAGGLKFLDYRGEVVPW